MLDGYSKHCTLAYRGCGSCSKHDIFVAPEASLDNATSSRLQIGNTIDRTCTYDIARMARRYPFNDADDNGNESVTALESRNVSLCIYIEIVCHRYLIKCANGSISTSLAL